MAAVTILFAGCSDDGQNVTQADLTPVQILSTTSFQDEGSEHVITSNIELVDGKYGVVENTSYIDGVLQSNYVHTYHFYYPDGKIEKDDLNGIIRTFYYGSNGELIGTVEDASPFFVYWRYVYPVAGVVYAEKLDAPYDDLSAEVLERYIVEVNAAGIVLSAGRDVDLDGTPDSANTFEVTGDNITQVVMADGSVLDYSYSSTINTGKLIARNSYGQRVYNLLGARIFSGDYLPSIESRLDSKNVLQSEWDTGMYEQNAQLFVSQQTSVTTTNGGYDQTLVTQYIFE